MLVIISSVQEDEQVSVSFLPLIILGGFTAGAFPTPSPSISRCGSPALEAAFLGALSPTVDPGPLESLPAAPL